MTQFRRAPHAVRDDRIDQQVISLDDFTGLVPVVLTFVGTLPATDADAVIAAYNEIFAAEFGRQQVQLLIVTPESETHVRSGVATERQSHSSPMRTAPCWSALPARRRSRRRWSSTSRER